MLKLLSVIFKIYFISGTPVMIQSDLSGLFTKMGNKDKKNIQFPIIIEKNNRLHNRCHKKIISNKTET
jgi:hypothetical protein